MSGTLGRRVPGGLQVGAKVYSCFGVAGELHEGQDVPVVFRDMRSKRQPLAFAPHEIFYGGEEESALVSYAEWAFTAARPGGQYSVPLPPSVELTRLSSPRTISGSGELRTTQGYLYRSFAKDGKLHISRHPVGDPSESESWNTELTSWGNPRVFALLETVDDVDFVVSAAASLYRLRWQQSPAWTLTRTDSWQWWGDAVPVTLQIEATPGPGVPASDPIQVDALAILTYNYSECGISLVRVDTGEEIRASAIPWVSVPLDWPTISADINRPAENDAFRLHTLSQRLPLTAVRSSAFGYKRQPHMRGLLSGPSGDIDVIVPACNYSDQVVAVDPSSGGVVWSIDGWRDYDPGQALSPYERLTPVAIHGSHLLAFVSRLTICHRPTWWVPWYETASFGHWGICDNNTVLGDLSLREAASHPDRVANRGSFYWPDTFNVTPDWGGSWDYPGQDIWDMMGEALDTQHDHYEAWSPGDLRGGFAAISGVRHLFRTYDLANGEIVGEGNATGEDEPLVDSSAPGAPDWTKIVQPSGVCESVLKETVRTRAIGGPWSTDDWLPEIPEGKIEVRRAYYARRQGTWRICDNPESAAEFSYEGFEIPYPYSSGVTYQDYPGVAWSLSSSDQLSPPIGIEFSPLRHQCQSNTRPGIYWLQSGVEWTREEIVAVRWYADRFEADTYVDPAPRWDPTQATIVDGRAIFGPGRRVTGENPEGSSGGAS